MKAALVAASLLVSLAHSGTPGLDVPTVERSVARVEVATAIGTGFAVGPHDVLTANHVVEGADDGVTVIVGGASRRGSVVLRDVQRDLALIAVDGAELSPLSLATAAPGVADQVFAFGNPLGSSTSVTEGIVSAVDDRRIQTDAAVNPGNSGGPLVTTDGAVVGLVVSKRRDAEGVSYAVPVGVLRTFLAQAHRPSTATSVPTTAAPDPRPARRGDNRVRHRPDTPAVPGDDGALTTWAFGGIGMLLGLVLGVAIGTRLRRPDRSPQRFAANDRPVPATSAAPPPTPPTDLPEHLVVTEAELEEREPQHG
jgi:S1-C subfamily serine protease